MFRRRMKHSRGLKVNLFPPPSSSGSEGASRGYQLGSAARRKAVRGWGPREALLLGVGAQPGSARATPPTWLLPATMHSKTTAGPWGTVSVLTLLPNSHLGKGTHKFNGIEILGGDETWRKQDSKEKAGPWAVPVAWAPSIVGGDVDP